MTKDKFEFLCERVLVPRIGDLIHRHLSSVHEELEIIAAELARIERVLLRGEKNNKEKLP